MEFLKEFIKNEQVLLLEEFFKVRQTYSNNCEMEKNYKNELVEKIQENEEFLYVHEGHKKVRI